MSRTASAFCGKKALIACVVGGDPNIQTTEGLIRAAAREGADMVVVNVPFSDPIAEGAAAQEANQRALSAGCTVDGLFDMVQELRQSVDIPVVFGTYANPVFAYGTERFAARCESAGIDGLTVFDVPCEERAEFASHCESHGIDLIATAALTCPTRARKAAAVAKGFVLCASPTIDAYKLVECAKQYTKTPCVADAQTPEEARRLSESADGVTTGTAITELVCKYGAESEAHVRQYIRDMRRAIDGV